MRDLERETGVNRETIRVYHRMGLIPEPSRPQPNIAYYDQSHVDSIATVRKLQREQGLSLDQIKRAMNGEIVTFSNVAVGYHHLDELVAARLGIESDLVPISSARLRYIHFEEDLESMSQAGAITVHQVDGIPHVSRGDAQLLAVWCNMREAGFDETIGFTPDLVAKYVASATALAKWEIETFVALTENVVEEKKAAQMVQVGLSEMLSFFGIIRTRVALAALARQRPANPGAQVPRKSRKKNNV